MRHFALRLLGRTGPALVVALRVLLLPDLTSLNEFVGALQVPVGVVLLI